MLLYSIQNLSILAKPDCCRGSQCPRLRESKGPGDKAMSNTNKSEAFSGPRVLFIRDKQGRNHQVRSSKIADGAHKGLNPLTTLSIQLPKDPSPVARHIAQR